jgi:hypothetical protein
VGAALAGTSLAGGVGRPDRDETTRTIQNILT